MQEIDLKKGQLTRHVTRAVKAISDGYVIAVPMENAYAYICDAFNHDRSEEHTSELQSH